MAKLMAYRAQSKIVQVVVVVPVFNDRLTKDGDVDFAPVITQAYGFQDYGNLETMTEETFFRHPKHSTR